MPAMKDDDILGLREANYALAAIFAWLASRSSFRIGHRPIQCIHVARYAPTIDLLFNDLRRRARGVELKVGTLHGHRWRWATWRIG